VRHPWGGKSEAIPQTSAFRKSLAGSTNKRRGAAVPHDHRKGERASIALTTNAPFSEWGTVFTDARLVAAIVDRVAFNAHIIETGVQS